MPIPIKRLLFLGLKLLGFAPVGGSPPRPERTDVADRRSGAALSGTAPGQTPNLMLELVQSFGRNLAFENSFRSSAERLYPRDLRWLNTLAIELLASLTLSRSFA